jgi:ribosomal protein S18 acetylase RimI-like enzyme
MAGDGPGTPLAYNRQPSEREKRAFYEGFKAFNRQHTPADHLHFVFTAQTQTGCVVGGVDGVSYWGRLHVDNLFVSADWRGLGIGRQLMEMAELLARDRGCLGINVDTFTFQAPGFYEKLGFQKIGEVNGYLNDYRRIYYTKNF